MPTMICRIVWADHYKSKKESFFAGNMKYPKVEKSAHELLNFANEDGSVYGFVEGKGDRINLAHLGTTTSAAEQSGVTVIWAALDQYTKRLRVVGWYDNATAFRAPQQLSRSSERGSWNYYFKAKVDDAHLIPTPERYLEVPMKAKITDKGFIGQRNWFFPEQSPNYLSFLQTFSLLKTSPTTQRKSDVTRESFEEGQRFAVELMASTRNPKLVAAARRHHGFQCQACGFSFIDKYGELGRDFIEVHHLIPIASRLGSRATTLEDVRVVCANCHRMIHRRKAALTIEELKKHLR